MITKSLFPFQFINIYVFLTRSLNTLPRSYVFDVMNGNKYGKGRHVQWIREMQCVSNTLLKRTFLSFCRFAIRVIGWWSICIQVQREGIPSQHRINWIKKEREIELTICLYIFFAQFEIVILVIQETLLCFAAD